MISKTHTDLVIFDCDGVLVDSEPLSNDVMAQHISRLGWPMSGLEFCVASQGRHKKMAVSLGVTGLLDTFQNRIYSAVDIARPKPAPDLFLHAAHHMEVTPNRCVVIEDSQTSIASELSVIGYEANDNGELPRNGVTIVSTMDAISIH